MRLLFKAYFPSDTFNHLHQTTNQLLLKIFSTENYLSKISTHLYIDQDIANESLNIRIKKLMNNIEKDQYDNCKLI